ncbi:MAG TPA: hypothetical protein VM580_12800 [Labilithrix sp.]|jgi:hypothetical protein|nr:hypothetical protein [Labilithrix sp.]
MTGSASSFKHDWQYDPETGIIRVVPNGPISATDAGELMRLRHRDVPNGEAAFFMSDNRNVELTAEARKVLATEWEIGETYYAGWGAAFAQRSMLNLFMKALSLKYPIKANMFAEETAARAWLLEQRRAYLARKT